jgi:aldehyde dehydrogenase (NAD+)
MIPNEELAARLPTGQYIDGRWRDVDAGQIEHCYPATGRVQRQFPEASDSQVDEAVTAARHAGVAWAAASVEERQRVLVRLGELLDEAAQELRIVGALERGGPVRRKLEGFNAHPGESFAYAASWADKMMGATIPVSPGAIFDFTLIEPVGVIAVLPTWNGPLWAIAVAVAPALAVGCTVVVKSPELAPFSCALFARLCDEAGIPPGVVNVLSGGPDTGRALVQHAGVDKIHFTGGSATARRIQEAAAAALTPMVLELGGKSANIVFADADLDRAAAGAVGWLSTNAGQSCTGASRLLVQESVADELLERVEKVLAAVRVGDPLDPDVAMGPLISEPACDRVLAALARAEAAGGSIAAGGGRLGGELAAGYFISPTLVTGLSNDDEIAQTELFGPVVTAITFGDEDEAIALANDSAYALAGYLHTRDLSRALRCASALVAGSIGINGGYAPSGLRAPFGGFKDSGYGKENGPWGMAEFIRTKNVMVVL